MFSLKNLLYKKSELFPPINKQFCRKYVHSSNQSRHHTTHLPKRIQKVKFQKNNIRKRRKSEKCPAEEVRCIERVSENKNDCSKFDFNEGFSDLHTNFCKEAASLTKCFDKGTYSLQSNHLDGTATTKPSTLFKASALCKSASFHSMQNVHIDSVFSPYNTRSSFFKHHNPLTIQKYFYATFMKNFYTTHKKKDDNLAAVLYGKNDLRLEQRQIPKPRDDQVLLRMEVVGICGTDVHCLIEGRVGPFVVKKPIVIGHEASGTVVKVGRDVKSLKPGDRVAVEPGVPCRSCDLCRKGQYNLCPDIAFCATPPYDGSLARYCVHSADYCLKLPSHVTLEEGALLEPLACAVRACKRGNISVGSRVLILGAGPIGLVTLLAAKAYGAGDVVLTDIDACKLQLAMQLGADSTVLIKPKDTEEKLIKKIRSAFGNNQPTVSVDCSGVESALRIAVLATKSGGAAVFLGLGKPDISLPVTNAIFREVDIIGVLRFANDYPTALELVSSGKVNVEPLITHEYRMEDTLEAFDTAKTGQGNPIKILIHVNPEWQPYRQF